MSISIIVPVYNVVDYIDKCIRSIVGQSVQECEIIIVDDGSNDGSREKCREWADRDDRIKLIEQSNQGVSSARNEGIEASHGEYIVFVDGDDYLENDFLYEMEKCFEEYPLADIVLCGYKYDDCGKLASYSFFKGDRVFYENDRDELICRAIGVYNESIERKTHIGVPWAKMYRKSFLEAHNIRFDIDMPRMQDLIFNIKCFKRITQVVYKDKHLYNYVRRTQSTANGYNIRYVEQAKLIIERVNDELSLSESIKVREAAEYKTILLLIEAIRLMYSNKQCTYSLLKRMHNIRELCLEEPFQSAIRSSYRNINNSFSRTIFLYTLKLKLFPIAYLLVWIKYKGE